MADFCMPSLGADMETGTLVEWKVHPGDRVERGDIVAVVDTRKAAIEVEIYASGVIDELRVTEGETVPVGTVLATVRENGRAEALAAEPKPPPPEPAIAPAPPPPPVAVVAPLPAAVPAPRAAEPGERLRISPAARRRALELDVDPTGVTGTGPHGAIVLRDIDEAAGGAAVEAEVEAAPSRPEPRPPAPRPGADIRQAIAAAMTRSHREIPHYYLATTIEMSRAMSYLAARNAARPAAERVLSGALLLRATAVALAEVPELNGFWVRNELRVSEAIHLGTAIALRGGGVIAPALLDADKLSLDELMDQLRDLVSRARAGRLRGSEVSEATITVTNLGEGGPEAVFGLIYPPQVALVGFGAIVDRPWAIDGALKVAPVVTATLAGDHRASDGRRGGVFLEALARALQHPEDL